VNARIARVLGLAAISPLLAGAHCSEECASTTKVGAVRNLESTLYGPGVFAPKPRLAPIAPLLAPFEDRNLRVDASRPVAIVIASAAAAHALARADASKLRAGDRGDGYRVIALADSRTTVPLLDGASMADAAREDCDDGNTVSGDGCDAYCHKER
jgi:cysteine-rich repeat protein